MVHIFASRIQPVSHRAIQPRLGIKAHVPDIVVQAELVIEDREPRCECRAMASDVEEHLSIPYASGEWHVSERSSCQTNWVRVSFRPGDYKPQ